MPRGAGSSERDPLRSCEDLLISFLCGRRCDCQMVRWKSKRTPGGEGRPPPTEVPTRDMIWNERNLHSVGTRITALLLFVLLGVAVIACVLVAVRWQLAGTQADLRAIRAPAPACHS